MPKITEYIFLLLTFVVGITVGLYTATDFAGNINQATESKIARSVQDTVIAKLQEEYKLEKISANTNQEVMEADENFENAITVSLDEIKLSPNAEMTIKKKFALCGHTTINKMSIPMEMINYTEDEVKKKYTGWIIEKFEQDELILSKEIEANCENHYVLKIEDEKLKIYNELTEEKSNFVDEIDIDIELIPSIEINNLQEGVRVYGEEELNDLVENYTS